MSENKLRDILKEEYTDNPIINFLKYSELRWDRQIAYDEWRKSNDLDCVHLAGDLYADTIFSVWTPLKMCLQCSKTYPYSVQKPNEYPYKGYPFLKNIIKNIDIYLPRNDWEELYEFAELASTRANVMRLPDRGMQIRRIRKWVDGKWDVTESFYEQMPRTLYECFQGGEFRKVGREYFESDEDMNAWVKKQNLDMFFKDGVVSKETIKPLIERMEPNDCEWLKEKEELLEMLKNYNKILGLRAKKD